MSYSTFRRYKTQNSDLKTTIAQGKDRRNQKVVEALFKYCTGYKYYEEVPTKVKEDVLIKSVKKYKGPDLNAQKYTLIKKANWADGL
ncbi:hypothetical protein JMF89_00975 [Clostridiaceae bacterium UIB06]|uniref:Uncharacterized protein n=1 Tax=Clostridium thailandense TaxID=2794346 RepID=A0A949WWW2_9CLOT|nr:hypothetical protein [Clostridium thailandense]MBV7275272.1 hypothetical protein [Clostridium thailandense]MCH5135788.1 hypothetical protein [Clostridiaceae bacterium UIB06]